MHALQLGQDVVRSQTPDSVLMSSTRMGRNQVQGTCYTPLHGMNIYNIGVFAEQKPKQRLGR